MRHPRNRGLALPEVLVALMLGVLLVAAGLAVLQRCRALYDAQQSLAQAQDAARQALALLVSDVEHAGFYGESTTAPVELMAADARLAAGAELRQPGAGRVVTPVPGLPPGAHDCGVNFAVDLASPVEAADQQFRLGVDARDCAPTPAAGDPVGATDTLTVRHASLTTTAPRAGRLQVASALPVAADALRLFADGRIPAAVGPDHEVRDLDVRSYYIAEHSVGRRDWPALRVKALTESRGTLQFRDEEIMPGVEDLQVEIGLRALDDRRRVEFVTPDTPRARREPPVAVRLWLRVRADSTESGYRDDREWLYSNTRFAADASAARFRRILVSRTIALRNGGA